MKKIFILLIICISQNSWAECPNLEGIYKCINPVGKLYQNEIKQKNKNPTHFSFITNNKDAITIITDYKEREEMVFFDKRNFKRTTRSSCIGRSLIYEFILTDGLEITIRGQSQFDKTKNGYKKINKTFSPFDKTTESREDCKKIN